jgi:hypothetical protein
VLNGSFISSSVLATGNAGDISVNAKQLRIDGQNSEIFTGIYSTAWRGRGDAGNITLMIADKLSIVRGGIDSITYARGHVGDISLQANQLYIANTGSIASNTVAQGNAGKISVKVNQLTIDGGEKDGFTGITSSAGIGSTGNAGKINLAVSDSLNISNGGQIQNTVFG